MPITPGRRKPRLGKPTKKPLDQNALATGYKQGANTYNDTHKHLAARDYAGMSAPRVGGTVKPNATSGKLQGTASKASIRKSIKNIKNSAASPQAKRSALASYKKRK